MSAVLYLAIYLSAGVFAVGCARRVRQYASLPVHLRWELYPVPHEPPERAKHGGSYVEEIDWWTKPRRVNRCGELWPMLAEIFLLKSVWTSNRRLWWRSLLFHSGMFCIIATLAGQTVLSFSATPDEFATEVFRWLGYAGCSLVFAGAVALLLNRLLDSGMRDYTHASDYAHLLVIGVAAGLVAWGGWFSEGPKAHQLIHGILTFDTDLKISGVVTAGLLLCAALVGYIPFSRMAHFIGKYFGYHSIRWDDAPNHRGTFAEAIGKNLAHRPTWRAHHIGADGTKTWAEVATANPVATEVRK